jgi:hypothetical protein
MPLFVKLRSCANAMMSFLVCSPLHTNHFMCAARAWEPQIVNSGLLEGSFFSILGLNPTIGRLIGPDDDHASQPSPVVVLSWAFWKGRFNLDPSILGNMVRLREPRFWPHAVPFSGLLAG